MLDLKKAILDFLKGMCYTAVSAEGGDW